MMLRLFRRVRAAIEFADLPLIIQRAYRTPSTPIEGPPGWWGYPSEYATFVGDEWLERHGRGGYFQEFTLMNSPRAFVEYVPEGKRWVSPPGVATLSRVNVKWRA